MKHRMPRRMDWRLEPAKKTIPAMTEWQLLLMGASRAVTSASNALSGFADTISKAIAVPIFHKSVIEKSWKEELVAHGGLRVAGEWWLDDAVGLPDGDEVRSAKLVGVSLVRAGDHDEDRAH